MSVVAMTMTAAAAALEGATLVHGAPPPIPLVQQLTIFLLAIFVGYYVVWSGTPARHTPLMSVTNAISSVIVVGALLAAGGEGWSAARILGLIAIALASVNIFGGFAVTQRMLGMYRKKERPKKGDAKGGA